MSFPPGTEMFQFPGFASCAYGFSARYPCGWVAPFGDPRIKACSRLPGACRSVPRPSSPLGAKASTRCPCFPRPTPATTAPRPAKGRARRSPWMGESNNLQKAYPCFLDARPRRKKAGVRPCLPAPARATTHRGPKTGLGARERAVITTSRCERSGHRPHRWRQAPPFEARGTRKIGACPAGGEGVPLGFRRPDGPGRRIVAAPPGSGRGAMVGLGRLERPTSRLSGVRSNQLSYRPESHPNRIAGPTPRPGPKRGGPRGRRSIGCAKGRADGGGGP
jgi:hypothetical protein